jgi:hypothetical protein
VPITAAWSVAPEQCWILTEEISDGQNGAYEI